jgi:hypothetical protein
MTIPEMQDQIQAWGWQWQEHVFNDGTTQNCYLQCNKNTNPHVFGPAPGEQTRKDREGNVGWGRFPRQTAWEFAYAYIREREIPNG